MTSVGAEPPVLQARQLTAPPARQTHRTHDERFDAHLAARSLAPAERQPEEASAALSVPPLVEGRLGAGSANETVPLHLRTPTGQAARIYAWGLHVNGYLSDLHPSAGACADRTYDASLRQEDCAGLNASTVLSVATGEANAGRGECEPCAPAGATTTTAWAPSQEILLGDEPAAVAIHATASLPSEPFQRTLVRWFERGSGRVLFLRDFRISHADIGALAERLRRWFAQADSNPVRIVINGRAQPDAPSVSCKEQPHVR